MCAMVQLGPEVLSGTPVLFYRRLFSLAKPGFGLRGGGVVSPTRRLPFVLQCCTGECCILRNYLLWKTFQTFPVVSKGLLSLPTYI